ncbi:Putative cation efflux protein [Colletotrichum destructivum]|uniref:Cation efflux protein n=1 Tax=Colletotrichum destructivum TaxID=34406 RepID=A0AAX4IP17_9PEZI|nr:Putative cation efflux protein [Colletotrichum destructivum]
MSSPQEHHRSSSPRVGSFKRPSVLSPDIDPYPLATRGNGALVSLIRNRSNATLRESLKSPAYLQLGHDDDDHESTSLLSFLQNHSDDDHHHRSAAEERRLSELIFGPQMRSMRLIGNSNPRYQWERYWKTEAELEVMPMHIRKYYERNNDLIRMYLYIDQLLDSSVPHDLLNEYHQALDASAYRPVDVPQTITEESPTPTSPPSRGGLAYGTSANASVQNSSTEQSSSANSIQQKAAKRKPKDIFRSTESTPLLNGSNDEEEGLADQPKPEIPWLEDGDLDSSDPIVTLAIWVNFIANAFLLIGKVLVVISVPSVSVLASLVDAVLDFLSTAIVWTTTRLIAASQNDQHSYPVGRRRLEPLGVLVFSIVMVTSFCQVALEAIQRLMSPDHEIVQLGIPAIAIMVGTVVIKGLCWLWCRLIKNSSVRALADDAMTDVIFNTGSILFPIVGYFARIWWLDALGGLLLSGVVIVNWSQTSMHHVRNLTGFSATSDERNLLLYLTMRFATSIRQIQNLRAYHAGDKLFVEVDIVLNANMPLKDSHDLSEVLTYFLESVPIVDRAFVHVDYATYNVDTHIAQ